MVPNTQVTLLQKETESPPKKIRKNMRKGANPGVKSPLDGLQAKKN
jgi:hypothetical protein